MALIDKSKRSATCQALGEVEVVVIAEDVYQRLFDEPSAIGTTLRRLLLSSLCCQLTGANAYFRDLIGNLSEQRESTVVHTDPAKPPENVNTSADTIIGLTAKLGGWDAPLSALEELEEQIEYIVDYDQQRALNAKKLR